VYQRVGLYIEIEFLRRGVRPLRFIGRAVDIGCMDSRAKSRVYRAYRRGEITRGEAIDKFGDDADEFESFDSLMDVVDSTPTREPSDDLFSD
jgi:hypothetical protein